jgi:hypothetical protein
MSRSAHQKAKRAEVAVTHACLCCRARYSGHMAMACDAQVDTEQTGAPAKGAQELGEGGGTYIKGCSKVLKGDPHPLCPTRLRLLVPQAGAAHCRRHPCGTINHIRAVHRPGVGGNACRRGRGAPFGKAKGTATTSKALETYDALPVPSRPLC